MARLSTATLVCPWTSARAPVGRGRRGAGLLPGLPRVHKRPGRGCGEQTLMRPSGLVSWISRTYRSMPTVPMAKVNEARERSIVKIMAIASPTDKMRGGADDTMGVVEGGGVQARGSCCPSSNLSANAWRLHGKYSTWFARGVVEPRAGCLGGGRRLSLTGGAVEIPEALLPRIRLSVCGLLARRQPTNRNKNARIIIPYRGAPTSTRMQTDCPRTLAFT